MKGSLGTSEDLVDSGAGVVTLIGLAPKLKTGLGAPVSCEEVGVGIGAEVPVGFNPKVNAVFGASVTNAGTAGAGVGTVAGAVAGTGDCIAGFPPNVKVAGLIVSAGLAAEEVVDSVKSFAPNVDDGALEVEEGA